MPTPDQKDEEEEEEERTKRRRPPNHAASCSSYFALVSSLLLLPSTTTHYNLHHIQPHTPIFILTNKPHFFNNSKINMPRAKGDTRPRGRMTAYAFFVQTAREEQKRLHPGGSVVFADFSRNCAGRWNSLSEEEKRPYKLMAERDKNRFEAEMKQFPGEKQRRGGKRKRRSKDPNAPKRSLSAFFWFCNDERQKVKGMNPEYGIGDVAKELGRLWALAAPETKQKYQAMSDKDKARYEREMHLYKSNPAPAAAHDDDEEEESDDEY